MTATNTHLNQLLAVAKGTKTQAGKRITAAYHMIQRAEPWSGISRTYRPKTEDGDRLPGEEKLVQVRATDVINEITDDVVRMIDVQASLDTTNQVARADISVNGTPLAREVSASTLLFLEKQLVDLATLFSKMPTLDIADKWEWNTNARAYQSLPLETVRTKKVPRNHVLAEATDKHPAQVQVFTEDIVEGYWLTTKFSGAMEGEDRKAILDRIQLLQDAVKQARQRANETPVTDVRIGAVLMQYIIRGAAQGNG